MIDPELQVVIKKSLEEDPWKGRWAVVNEFGGGWAVELEVAEFLHSLVRTIKPDVTVETGTHKGFSALMMAKAIQQNGCGHLYTADMVDHGVKALFERFKVSPFVTFLPMHSVDMLNTMPKDMKIDFLWLDADHAEESVLSEMEAAVPLLKPGSYIGFHDALIDPREDRAIKKIRAQYPSWEYVRFSSARGVDLMRTV